MSAAYGSPQSHGKCGVAVRVECTRIVGMYAPSCIQRVSSGALVCHADTAGSRARHALGQSVSTRISLGTLVGNVVGGDETTWVHTLLRSRVPACET